MVTDIMIRGIYHTGISTPDLERAIEFYSGLLGRSRTAPFVIMALPTSP